MLGYSVGEYVAACLAGVLSLADALRLVAYRAELIADLPAGGMLAVTLAEDDLAAVLPGLDGRGVDVAVTTGSQVVLAGPNDVLDAVTDELRQAEIPCRRLPTTHAFHSRMLRPAADELTRWVAKSVTPHPPRQPYVSNVTGRMAIRDQVTDPAYWAAHMCGPVRFGDALATVLLDPDLAFVEIGAGRSLGALLRAHPECDRDRWPLVTATLSAAADTQPADALLAGELAKLWLAGVDIDWSSHHGVPSDAGSAQVHGPGRVPLPTYPFQHQDYWLERQLTGAAPLADADDPMTATARLPRLPETEWLSVPVWRQTAPSAAMAEPPSRWLLYTDAGPADTIADALHGWLSATSVTVVQVRPGDRLAEDATGWTIRPGDVHDTRAMLDALRQRDQLPDRVVHLWTLAERTPERDDIADVDDVVRLGLHTLVALAQAAGELGVEALSLDIVTAASQQVLGTTSVVPARATLLGACRLIPVEYPKAAVRLVDLEHGAVTDADLAALRAELSAEPADRLVGLRSGRRWVPGYDVLHMTENSPDAGPIRRGGTYLVTGGLGGVGLALAQRLAEQFKARLVLFGRTPVPPREQW
jgi:acyl transferase domain-containing protein